MIVIANENVTQGTVIVTGKENGNENLQEEIQSATVKERGKGEKNGLNPRTTAPDINDKAFGMSFAAISPYSALSNRFVDLRK